MVTLVKNDLEFILKQIKLSESHAAGTPLTGLIDSPLLPWGLRTVDGSYNNIIPGRELWGASGQPFELLTSPVWRNENDDVMPPGYVPGNNNNYGAPGSVVDADPRIISNLIVDQTLDNPAAIAAALRYAGAEASEFLGIISQIQAAHAAFQSVSTLPPTNPAYITLKGQLDSLLEQHGIEMSGPSIVLPNEAPDEGLSASYNSWFTLFGQFFDHGLDLVSKGGNGTIYIPLQPDDPLYDHTPGARTNFMAVTRAAVGEGAANVTTPWVDQNQTYTSHPSHQVFLREYHLVDGRPVATGKLLEGERGLATWGDVKAQALMLGIQLTDIDVFAVPLIRTDAYGKFIPDANGYAQVITGLGPDGIPNTADDIVVSGTPDAPVNPTEAGAIRTANAFLDDIAHSAVPVQTLVPVTGSNGEPVFDEDGNPVMALALQADPDNVAGNPVPVNNRGQNTQYDDELLDAHYITGDGRGNENIGLSAVHHIFHSEHNRVADHVKALVLEAGDLAFLNEWLLNPVSTLPTSEAAIAALVWDGERIFQAARFTTEMQYQHLVFEEFARKVQPDIDVFMVQPDVEINPAIFAEFAHVVYRFGHSMLNETVDRIEADGTVDNMTLFNAFLNPLAFGSDTMDHQAAAGAIIRGMTAQVGNEIDEFTTNVLRNQLVGIPLDLAAINIARGRDTGVPSLNEARAQFQAMANGDSQLKPYDSWIDFALNMKNPESIVNFIAAYGTHESVTSQTSVEGKRDAAMALVFGGAGAPADRMAFLNATGQYANRKGGLDNVDLWVGGLAEKKMPFGGMLGSTFAFVFELQMENLQHADRFYYLSRVQGLNLLTELENNSLAKMVMRNTDLGETQFALPGDIFSTPDHVLYVDLAKQLQLTGKADPTHDNPWLEAISSLVERRDANGDGIAEYIRYNGSDHVVIAGSSGNDTIISGGGDDTIWGFGGNDYIEAGYGVDKVMGGDGDDIIVNAGTDIGETDMLHGDAGNDVIHGGSGMALIFGGSGRDFLMTGPDGSEIRGGTGNDFIMGGNGPDALFGNEGDDWIEAGGLFDYIAGDNGELFFNSTIIGHDVLDGGSGDTDYDADSGDDIMFAGEGIQKFIGMWGHDWVIHKGQKVGAEADMNIEVFTTLPLEVLRDRYSQVEAVSGWTYDDIIRGDDRSTEEVDPADPVPLVADPTPEGNFVNNELDIAGIQRIAGLDQIITNGTNGTPNLMRTAEYWADGSGQTKSVFVGGNILLGGGGSDIIDGRGGDDVIDGDAWLNVRIRFELGGTGYTTDSMAGKVYLESAYVAAQGNVEGLTAQFGGQTLDMLMLNRTVNPGALSIAREILYDDSGDDTAVYWDVRENYEITAAANGALIVSHVTQTAGAVDPVTGKNRVSDGTDTLYNIEWLQFADGRVSTDGLVNSPATGRPIIVDPTPTNGLVSPTQGLPLSSNLTAIADANGLPTSANAYAYQWQVSSNSGQTWTNIAGATGSTFTPNNGLLGIGGQVGDILRLRISYTDNDGHSEILFSDPTLVVGANWNAVPLLSNNFNGTAGDDIANGTGGIFGAGASDVMQGNGGNDLLNGAGGTDTAVYVGAPTNFNFALDGSGQLNVIDMTGAEGTDTLISIEQLRFSGSTYTLTNGTGAGQTLNGGTGGNANRADVILGQGGNDTLNGNGGNDILVGGAGNDTVNGGAGNDLILWRVGDGRDLVDGGTGTDTLHVAGNSSAETFRIYSRPEALAAGLAIAGGTQIVITRNGTDTASIIAELTGVEEIVVNGMGGGDTFIPIGNFTGTSLAMNTITLEGSEGDDTVDISALTSAHRVVFRSKGGSDTIVGMLRPQDVVELADGKTIGDYALTSNANGSTTIISDDHSVTFFGNPKFGRKDDDDHDDDDDDVVPGRDDDGPCDDDDDGNPVQPPAGTGTTKTGTPQADVLVGTAGNDTLIGLAGDDHILGADGDDVILGGQGDDFLSGEGGRDVIFGGTGNDTIMGGAGNDMLYGDAGNDRIFGGDGDDMLFGGAGDDVIYGGAGNDIFVAEKNDGNDVYYGDDGKDTLDMSAITAGITADLGTGFMGRGSVSSAQSGNDTIWGIDNIVTGSGNDVITASGAINVMDGGGGNDTFRFNSAADANGDTIVGFQAGDKIDLSAMDANGCVAGKQSFTLVSQEAFSGRGQLMVTYESREDGNYAVIQGNVSGDNQPDFKLSVKSNHQFTAGDFNL